MCAGAILQARVDTVVWGAPNKLLGADGSWIRYAANVLLLFVYHYFDKGVFMVVCQCFMKLHLYLAELVSTYLYFPACYLQLNWPCHKNTMEKEGLHTCALKYILL